PLLLSHPALPRQHVFSRAPAQASQETHPSCDGFLTDLGFADATIASRLLSEKFARPAMERAGTRLETIVAKALHLAPAEESPLLAWSVVCGSAVAARTRAVSFSGGILRVEVADTGWRHELTSLAPRYLASIKRYSAVQVRRIEFVVKN